MAVVAVLFSGCGGKIPYNAVLYDTAIDWCTEEYATENETYNFTQHAPNTLPKNITHIITDNEEFERAFASFPVAVDFGREMLVVHFLTDARYYIGGVRVYANSIKKLSVANGAVNIEISSKSLKIKTNPPAIDFAPPIQTCLVIKMDKIDVTGANVKFS